MRPQKVADHVLLENMISVFRFNGYEGASLNDLANASGLKKASLYHRFPNGKKEIGSAVLAYITEGITNNIYQVLADKNVSADIRLNTVLENINEVYDGGKNSCILRVLSMDSGLELFGDQIKFSMNIWIDAFTLLGIDFGSTKKEAKSKANKSLVLIQGSLVVTKAMSSLIPFQEALKDLRNLYIE
ncbi:hypothetical protein A8C32_18420 [Flavivirga aquatica]|uniref:HTH tetR-type domain-containing protein n=1 Tax=Flavivirga aquatica TaxID=1849968 RepID=A0A1E5T7U2_9FLAO|nr:TetR/AcrR family transcriptional regulator [Flavivirga aquatica]OEK07408.1 hypothetical protein A8C32_18420 [Flavivirga aquatica]